MYLRKGTFDTAIRYSVSRDYPATPDAFADDQVVLDVGCHIGAFCHLAADRGATVVGYEANRENYGLACINTADRKRVTIRHAAVWRSDRSVGEVLFVPHVDPQNTGGGSVLFDSADDVTAFFARRGWTVEDALPSASALPSSHAVATIALDAVLEELGEVRLMKIDAEGVEYPILLTARRLRQVEIIVGEYHEFTKDEMNALSPAARVGDEAYSAALLRDTLSRAGFEVALQPPKTRGIRWGLFTARRR